MEKMHYTRMDEGTDADSLHLSALFRLMPSYNADWRRLLRERP